MLIMLQIFECISSKIGNMVQGQVIAAQEARQAHFRPLTTGTGMTCQPCVAISYMDVLAHRPQQSRV